MFILRICIIHSWKYNNLNLSFGYLL